MKFVEIKFSNIKNEIEDFLKTQYNKASVLFSNASPYGQILSVIENLHQLSFLYLKNAITSFDVTKPQTLNERNIKNAAILAGHVPSRAISASGVLRFIVKPDVDVAKDIPNGKIIISNKTTIKNLTNGLFYSFNIGRETITYTVGNSNISGNVSNNFNIPIIQGKWTTNTYTGTGDPLQTLNIVENSKKEIENYNVEVTIDGVLWENKKHLWDMATDEQAVVIKTGFDGGINVIFGNSNFGAIPPIGASITVSFLLSDGSNGNIFNSQLNDWTFVDDIKDVTGKGIDETKIFDIQYLTNIDFGNDSESLDFTRSLLPISSPNFVLATPQQYAYEILKLGMFSYVNAYVAPNDKSAIPTINIAVVPKISLFSNASTNYFAIPNFESVLLLDKHEKDQIANHLRANGNIQLSRKIRFIDAVPSYYIINMNIVKKDESVIFDDLKSEIISILSDYFIGFNGMINKATGVGKISKLDIIKNLTQLEDIISIDMSFVSKNNEDFHKKWLKDIENDPSGQNVLNTYNANFKDLKLGLDHELGDIIFSGNEIPVFRGGWENRFGVPYSDDINDKNRKVAVNITEVKYKKDTI